MKWIFLLIGLFISLPLTAQAMEVSAWLPTTWDQEDSWTSFAENTDHITELNPFWYYFDTDFHIHSYEKSAGVKYRVQNLAGSKGIPILATITNSFDASRVSRMMKSDQARRKLVSDLVQLAVKEKYAGIDLDFEGIYTVDRGLFTLFVTELATALHTQDKLLSVVVQAKTSEANNWNGPGGQDWVSLSTVADRFKIMAYDEHTAYSRPGAVASLGWVRKILDYAITRVPPEKLYLGVPFYGYGWVIKNPHNSRKNSPMSLLESYYGSSAYTHQKIREIIAKYGVAENWDPDQDSRYLRFTSDIDWRTRLIYYEDSESLAQKFELAKSYGVAGISIWRLGSEDPQNWSAIAAARDQIFLDVVPRHPQFVAITTLTRSGVFKQAEYFYPELTLTRAQAVKIVVEKYQLAKYLGRRKLETPFFDILPDAWERQPVGLAYSLGIISLPPDRTFRPDDPITLVEFLKLSMEAREISRTYRRQRFVGAGAWFAPYVEAATDRGYLSDLEVGNFQTITRGQAASILYKIK